MSARLREVMLAADGAGDLEGDDVQRGHAEHPVCGDVVDIAWRTDGDTVTDFAWRASGCPATIAVAAAARDAVVGTSAEDVPRAVRARLNELGGLAAHEHHAEKMLLRAFGFTA